MEGGHAALTLVLALAVGVIAQSAARHLRLPGIVLLLIAGSALGPDGLGWVDPRSLGDGLLITVDLAVAVILFEGGLNLEISRLRREQGAIRRLVTWGALITLAGGMLAARALLDWPWVPALLFGGLVVVTGPTVIGPLIEMLRLRPRIATLLEAEGVLIDPIGAILAVLLLEVALGPWRETLADQATTLLFRLGFGTLAGVAAGFALGGLLRARRIVPEGHENILALASVLLLSQGCDALVSHSGILAVTVAGVVVGNLRTRVDRDLREFKDQLTVLLIGLLFVLLAADIRLADVQALGWGGIGVVAALVFLVRPLNVLVNTAGSGLGVRDKLLIAWLAPRGIVAAAVASLASGALEGRGLEGGTELRALVFLTIAGTVLLAGVTALPVAALLGVRLPGRDRVAVLGAQGLGLELAADLKAAGATVVLVDSNPQNCRRAQEAGHAVVFGDALQERTMLRLRPESVGVAIGLTPNQMLNGLFVSRIHERFKVPRGYVAAARPEAGIAPEVVGKEQVDLLFEASHDVERWDVRARHGEVLRERWVFGEAPEGDVPETGERCVIVSVRRGKQVLPMHRDFAPKPGDVAGVALYRPEADKAREILAARGWRREEEPAAEAEANGTA